MLISFVLEFCLGSLTSLIMSTRCIDEEIKRVTSRIECFRGVAAQLEAESSKTSDSIKSIELEVKKSSKEIKQFLDQVKQSVDRQESDLLHKLQSLKSAAETEVQSHRDILQLAVTEMESFVTNSVELKSKGSASDIRQAANDVRDRAKELLQTWVIPGKYHAPSYKFTRVNIDELLRDDQHSIGHVDKGNMESFCRNVLVEMVYHIDTFIVLTEIWRRFVLKFLQNI